MAVGRAGAKYSCISMPGTPIPSFLSHCNCINMSDINIAVFEINSALGARRAHFHGRAHVFRTCAPDVRTFIHSIIIAIYQRSAQNNSRAHS